MRSLETDNNWDWNSTAAPWLQNVGLGRLQETSVLHILRATQMCQCADPRDRVFGILYLLSNNSADSALRADYSLSLREMVIGLFSHTLLKLRDLDVLRFAAGLRNYAKLPSWMPDLSLPAYDVSSQNELLLSNCQRIFGDREVHHRETPWYLGTTVDSSTGVLSIDLIHLLEFQDSPRRMEDVELDEGWHLFTISGRHSNLVFSSNVPLNELIVPTRDHLFRLDEGNGSAIFLVMSLEIDNNTYKLMGVCQHVGFQDQESDLRESIQIWNASEIRDASGRVAAEWELQGLNLRSLQYNLHTQLQALNTDDTSTDIWTDNLAGISSFKARMKFGHGSNCTLKPILMSLINEHNNIGPGFMDCLSLCIPASFRPQVEGGKYILVTLTEPLAATIDSLWWDNPANKWRLVGQTCFGSSSDKNCNCQKAFGDASIIRDSERLGRKSHPKYLLLVDLLSEYTSREEDGRDFGSVSGHCMLWQDYTAYGFALFYMWPHEKGFILDGVEVLWPEGLAVQIRVPREAIESQIKQMMAWKTLHRLNRVSPISSEDDLDAILGSPNPNPDFRSIAVPGWPTEVMDDFNIDGSIQRVSIQ